MPTGNGWHPQFGSIRQSIGPETEAKVYRESENSEARDVAENRRHPQFKLEADIRVFPRKAPVVGGHRVDISQSGISAMLVVELPVGEVVGLEFSFPLGDVDVDRVVRQRNAFRNGLQFLESESAKELITPPAGNLRWQKPLAMPRHMNPPPVQ